MRKLLSARWIASHLFVVTVVVIMVNLGFWQLRRLDERQVINAAVAAAMEQAPVDIGDLLTMSELPPDYTATKAEGRYVGDSEVLIANRSFEGRAGSWLATPLRLDDGRLVMVVRGWIPRLSVAGIDERPTSAPPGRVTVIGLAFGSVGGGRVGVKDPGETPEISRPDLDRFEEVTGLDVADVWIRLRRQSTGPGELPVPVPLPSLSEGSHLSYAFQWFFFSAGAVVVYGLILGRVRRDRSL